MVKKKSKEKNWGENGTGRREKKMGLVDCNLFYGIWILII